MKKIRPLSVLLLLFAFAFATTLAGQSRHRLSCQLEAGYANWSLRGNYSQEYRFSPGHISGAYGWINSHLGSPTIGAGLQYTLNRNWGIGTHLHYSYWQTNYLEAFLRRRDIPHPARPLEAKRWLHAISMDFQFARTFVRYAGFQLDASAGLSGILRWHYFRSGFVYHEWTGHFEMERFSRERLSSWGIAVGIQPAWYLNDRVRLGLNLSVTPYFKGDIRYAGTVFLNCDLP